MGIIQYNAQLASGCHYRYTIKVIRATVVVMVSSHVAALWTSVNIFQCGIISKDHDFAAVMDGGTSSHSCPPSGSTYAVDVEFLLGGYHAFPNRIIVPIHHRIHRIPHIRITQRTHIIHLAVLSNITRRRWLMMQHMITLGFNFQSPQFVHVVHPHLVVWMLWRMSIILFCGGGCIGCFCIFRVSILSGDVVDCNGHCEEEDACCGDDAGDDEVHGIFAVAIVIAITTAYNAIGIPLLCPANYPTDCPIR
mmetsp:Transcript_40582/g.73180  ORF Transcript_40582/g.73180 Transcript_40582/m.73180 type:complete len:250 (+) Transcript_40582:620-1369(+)